MRLLFCAVAWKYVATSFMLIFNSCTTFGFLRLFTRLPERRAEVVTLHELVLTLQNELREAALAVGVDRLHGEVGAWSL